MNRTYSPIALVIDDDDAVIRRMKNGFLEDTSMGVLVAIDLKTAAGFLEDLSVKIDAVITDLNFSAATRYDNLNSGIDLLEFSKEHRPNVTSYVLSVDAASRSVQDACAAKHLRVDEFFPKLGPYRNSISPWVAVERACLSKSLKKNVAVREAMEKEGIELRDLVEEDDIVDTIRELSLPRLTYLLEVPNYRVKKPIEVLCVKEGDHQYRASALQIGLITDGEGTDTAEALEDLARLIGAEADLFTAEAGRPVGYAAHVKNMLDQFVERA